MSTTEIRFSGFGGQGIIRCALITGKALSLYDDKFATITQSFGPEARGSACSAQLVVSAQRVLYPYITAPAVLMALSQEAYDKYHPEVIPGGTLIVEEDLVKLGDLTRSCRCGESRRPGWRSRSATACSRTWWPWVSLPRSPGW